MTRLKHNWNALLGLNAWRAIYLLFSVSVLLQQFPVTEPAAAGFFWLTLLTALCANEAWRRYGARTKEGLRAFVLVQLIGAAVQAGIFYFGWEILVDIDETLRKIRSVIGGGNPLFPMWVVWIFATMATIRHAISHGLITWPREWKIRRW